MTIDPGQGYKSVFIFECKNWQEAVGKNEVIIFAEKIAVTQAQRGFFVAKSFTKDAQSQAATNPRISLLIASERDPTTVPAPFGFHVVLLTSVSAGAIFYARGGDHSRVDSVDLDTAVAELLGKAIELRKYLSQWADEASRADVGSFNSHRAPEGTYERSAQVHRDFAPGELTLNDRDLERAEQTLCYNVTVVRPAVVSYFEVETRGRFISLAPIQHPSGPEMHVKSKRQRRHTVDRLHPAASGTSRILLQIIKAMKLFTSPGRTDEPTGGAS